MTREALEAAREGGKPTTELESELKRIQDRIKALYRPPAWDPIHAAWPALRAKTAEIRTLASEESPLDLNNARRLMDFLYLDIHPKLNRNLQLAVMMQIKELSDRGWIAEDARGFLRDRVLEYYYATQDQCDASNLGPMCCPISMFYLAQSIASVTDSQDAEAITAFRQLKSAAANKCEILQRGRERFLIEAILTDAEEGMSVSQADIAALHEVASEQTNSEDIVRLLRLYRKVLRGPARKLNSVVIKVINNNLAMISHQELDSRTWELWADVLLTLGHQRANPELRRLVLDSLNEPKETPRAKAFARVKKVFKRARTVP